MAGNALNVDTQRPRGEIELDNADPESFQLAIRQRISDSIAVIGMFLPNDSSVPAELSIAAELGKPILIIHQKDAQVPRILSGERVLEDKDEHRMTALIEQFIRQSIPQFRTA
jgi:hypothetical protein